MTFQGQSLGNASFYDPLVTQQYHRDYGEQNFQASKQKFARRGNKIYF